MRKHETYHKSHIAVSSTPNNEVEVVTGTDCIGKCKAEYLMIMTKATYVFFMIYWNLGDVCVAMMNWNVTTVLSSPPVFGGVRVTRALVFYACFVDRCLSFFFILLAIALSPATLSDEE